MRAKAFSPSHVSGFFEIHLEGELLKSGSRGAGICLSEGVETIVELKKSNRQEIEIFLNEKKEEANTTKNVVKSLIGKKKYSVKVRSYFKLPVSQGFGISGAGALSTALALGKIFNLSYYDSVAFAHRAEIEEKSGLGDVSAQSRGGIVIRKIPGLPPYGFVDNILTNEREIYACVIGKEIKTKDILSSKEKCRKINESGKKCINSIIKKPTLENLFKLSKEFAITTGLASSEIVDAIEEVNKYGMASMCMLGNSLFAVGNVKKILQKYGRIYECMIGSCGYVHDY